MQSARMACSESLRLRRPWTGLGSVVEMVPVARVVVEASAAEGTT